MLSWNNQKKKLELYRWRFLETCKYHALENGKTVQTSVDQETNIPKQEHNYHMVVREQVGERKTFVFFYRLNQHHIMAFDEIKCGNHISGFFILSIMRKSFLFLFLKMFIITILFIDSISVSHNTPPPRSRALQIHFFFFCEIVVHVYFEFESGRCSLDFVTSFNLSKDTFC